MGRCCFDCYRTSPFLILLFFFCGVRRRQTEPTASRASGSSPCLALYYSAAANVALHSEEIDAVRTVCKHTRLVKEEPNGQQTPTPRYPPSRHDLLLRYRRSRWSGNGASGASRFRSTNGRRFDTSGPKTRNWASPLDSRRRGRTWRVVERVVDVDRRGSSLRRRQLRRDGPRQRQHVSDGHPRRQRARTHSEGRRLVVDPVLGGAQRHLRDGRPQARRSYGTNNRRVKQGHLALVLGLGREIDGAARDQVSNGRRLGNEHSTERSMEGLPW